MRERLHSPVADSLTLPVAVHVFEGGGEHLAFDVRNFAILALDADAAAVLARAHSHPLAEIVADLEGEVAADVVRSRYLQILELVEDGTLSSRPVPRPSRPRFDHLVLMLAGGCNMGCLYCFERDVPTYRELNLLSRERADAILEWFFRHQEGDAAHIQLYGGEPLLNWPVLQHVVERMEEWAGREGIALTKYLITNGTLLDADRIRWLREHGVSIQVSVDGTAATHDRFRVFKSGRPTMSRIEPNLEELARQDADYNLRAVMTRHERSPWAVTEGLRSLGAKRVSFEVVSTDLPAARFTDADWDDFNRRYREYVSEPYASWPALPDEMQAMIIKICERRRVFYGCGAGLREVTVAPDGGIYECQRMEAEPIGHVDRDLGPPELDSRFLTMVDDREVCRDCWARYLCGGGCMEQARVGHGSDAPLPHYCAMKRTLVEGSIAVIRQLRDHAEAGPPAEAVTPHGPPVGDD